MDSERSTAESDENSSLFTTSGESDQNSGNDCTDEDEEWTTTITNIKARLNDIRDRVHVYKKDALDDSTIRDAECDPQMARLAARMKDVRDLVDLDLPRLRTQVCTTDPSQLVISGTGPSLTSLLKEKVELVYLLTDMRFTPETRLHDTEREMRSAVMRYVKVVERLIERRKFHRELDLEADWLSHTFEDIERHLASCVNTLDRSDNFRR